MTERKNLFMSSLTRTMATCHIFNTARRKRLNLHTFEQSFVESRRSGRRVDSRSLTVPQMEPHTTRHCTAAETGCRAMLSTALAGVRNPVRVLARRLADLPDAPAGSRPTVAWCGECEDERPRTITSPGATGPIRPRSVYGALRRHRNARTP